MVNTKAHTNTHVSILYQTVIIPIQPSESIVKKNVLAFVMPPGTDIKKISISMQYRLKWFLALNHKDVGLNFFLWVFIYLSTLRFPVRVPY